MSKRELDRLEVITRAVERRVTQTEAAEQLGLSLRQVERLCAAYRQHGPPGLVSQQRGKPSNRKLPETLRKTCLRHIREHYADFGPTLAAEKLEKHHGLRVSVETLRTWMTEDGIWVPRAKRRKRPYQPRNRRACFGELIQIDGCDHEWFEDRGPRCTLLVYIDDATSRLAEAHFVDSESTFSYFKATRAYIERHGKPVAFYSDKASVFRVAPRRGEPESKGISQFARALSELNIDIICANTSQAKGRVERAHLTLQDRLVKELRLRGISTIEDANAFVLEYIATYNAKFGKAPRSSHDAHRRLRPSEDLDWIFTWQETRKLSKNLELHYKGGLFQITPSPETKKLVGRQIEVAEHEDGRVELAYEGKPLLFKVFDKNAYVDQAAVVSNKRLGAALKHCQERQEERDAARLANPKTTRREKNWIRRKSSMGHRNNA